MPGLRTSVSASVADVGIRLVAQMVSTVLIARILSPEDFGVALMVLSVTAFASALIGLPLEESLSQRPRLGIAHLRTALALSLGLAAAAVALAAALGPAIEAMAGAPGFATWLLVASLFLVGQGPGTISRALSRRHHRFVDLAACQSASVVAACTIAIPVALAGWGVLALVLQRMVPVVLYPALVAVLALLRGQRAWVGPGWHGARFHEMFRFSWLHTADVGVLYATPTILAFVVNARFGTALLGEFSIAQRLVEPLRTGILSIGHNLVFSLLVHLQDRPRQLVEAASRITVTIATLAVPAFLGLAATAPLLLPLLVGPNWDAAVPLSRLLCIAAAISVPLGYFFSGFSALGRPEWGLAGRIVGLMAMLAALEVSAALGLAQAAGVAVIALNVATVGVGVTVAAFLAGRGVARAMRDTGRVWIAAMAMAAAVSWIVADGGAFSYPLLELAAAFAIGAALYTSLLLVTCRSCLGRLMAAAKPAQASGP